jgi:transposase
MIEKRRKYSKEFKLEAIRMYQNGERSTQEVERELGITKGLLWKWIESLEKSTKKRRGFPGKRKDARHGSSYSTVRKRESTIKAG